VSDSHTVPIQADEIEVSASGPWLKDFREQPKKFADIRRTLQSACVFLAIAISPVTAIADLPCPWEERRRYNTATVILLFGSGGAIVSRFATLVDQWKANRRPVASVSRMAMDPAYQQIIGMGNDAVRLILKELELRPDQWFWALRAITGANPIQKEDRGKIRQMAVAWLKWGKEHGYR